MIIRIDKAIALYNARNQKKNRKEKRNIHDNEMNATKVGVCLYPESAIETSKVSMNRLTAGKAASLKFEKIKRLCEVLEVDANFLFEMPSKHDRDWKRLVMNE